MKTDGLLLAVERLQVGSVTVVGDVIMDVFISCSHERQSSEAPVPVGKINIEQRMPGGAGNVAANITALGGKAKLISVIGAGHTGQLLIELLKKHSINVVDLVIDQSRPTTKKTRILIDGNQVICLASETREPVAPWVVERIAEAIEHNGSQVIVLSDYDRGMISESLIVRMVQIAKLQGQRVIADVHVRDGLDAYFKDTYLITPNRHEAASWLKCSVPDNDSEATEVATQMMLRYTTNVLLTRDEQGMTLVTTEGELLHFRSRRDSILSVSGAGDTVVGTIALALAGGALLHEAVNLAAHTAAVVVGKPDTSVVTYQELHESIEKEKYI